MNGKKPGILLILDTNAIIYSVRNRVDLKDRVLSSTAVNRIVVPGCVVRELEGLARSNPYAKAALALSDRFEKIESEGAGDDCIIKCAKNHGASVLTNDRDLVLRLKDAGIRVLSLRRGAVIDSS